MCFQAPSHDPVGMRDPISEPDSTRFDQIRQAEEHNEINTVYRLAGKTIIWPLNELNMLSEAKPGFPRHPRVTHNDIIHKSDAKNIF